MGERNALPIYRDERITCAQASVRRRTIVGDRKYEGIVAKSVRGPDRFAIACAILGQIMYRKTQQRRFFGAIIASRDGNPIRYGRQFAGIPLRISQPGWSAERSKQQEKAGYRHRELPSAKAIALSMQDRGGQLATNYCSGR
jgi:hypothetical protein